MNTKFSLIEVSILIFFTVIVVSFVIVVFHRVSLCARSNWWSTLEIMWQQTYSMSSTLHSILFWIVLLSGWPHLLFLLLLYFFLFFFKLLLLLLLFSHFLSYRLICVYFCMLVGSLVLRGFFLGGGALVAFFFTSLSTGVFSLKSGWYQVSRTLLSILADLSSVVVWMVSSFSLQFPSSLRQSGVFCFR